MTAKCENPNLFCRVNVDSEMPHNEFVSFIARIIIVGVPRMNSVRSEKLDISVDENDALDAAKSREGADRWLYFRYTLEIDPVAGVSPGDYVTAVGSLLESLWSSGIDAVAACDFEEKLPRNVRRLKWDKRQVPSQSSFSGSPDPLTSVRPADTGIGRRD